MARTKLVILDAIADERRAMADLIDILTPEQWATPSLCGEWTVGQTCSHLLLPLTWGRGALIRGIIINGGNFDKFNDKATRAFATRPPSEIAAGLRDNATSRFHPPLLTHTAPLTDLMLHGQDIRRPLGLTHDYSELTLRTALDMLVSPAGRRALFVPKRMRLNEGLRFVATDLDWEWGSGELVAGPSASMAYAMTGRTASFAELTGPGVEVLRNR